MMKPEHWQQLDKLLHCVLERAPTERAAFLDEACAGDESLRKQVEALLAAHEEAGASSRVRQWKLRRVELLLIRETQKQNWRAGNRQPLPNHLEGLVITKEDIQDLAGSQLFGLELSDLPTT